jgi:hypothetical protein
MDYYTLYNGYSCVDGGKLSAPLEFCVSHKYTEEPKNLCVRCEADVVLNMDTHKCQIQDPNSLVMINYVYVDGQYKKLILDE